jgi:hypothetical protein
MLYLKTINELLSVKDLYLPTHERSRDIGVEEFLEIFIMICMAITSLPFIMIWIFPELWTIK